MAKKSSPKLQHPLEMRHTEIASIKDEQRDGIPVILEKAEGSEILDMPRKKFLVPTDMSVGQFMCVIRKTFKIKPEKAMIILLRNFVIATALSMAEIYQANKREDGCLYMSYAEENTYG
ncbi:unnamed protein product [Camellia sinensis]